jgi:hypothetical protein
MNRINNITAEEIGAMDFTIFMHPRDKARWHKEQARRAAQAALRAKAQGDKKEEGASAN